VFLSDMGAVRAADPAGTGTSKIFRGLLSGGMRLRHVRTPPFSAGYGLLATDHFLQSVRWKLRSDNQTVRQNLDWVLR